ncbi:MAG TPA: thioesterase family protein [Kineosporiaceae bacterium]|nr:thioesterase family protein [Kineosporiaceae bacterium]
MSHAFFHPLVFPSTTESVERLRADQACTGPWSADAMHGGPPSALLVRACERVAGAGLVGLRASIDFLAPVPVDEVTVRSRVIRGGRRVTLSEAAMGAGGRQVLHARTWLLRSNTTDDGAVGDTVAGDTMADGATTGLATIGPPTGAPTGAPPKGPQASAPTLTDWTFPYAQALEWRQVSGDPGGPGDAAVWARQRISLIDGEEPTGLQRAVLVADSGNGISAALDWDRFTFVNVDLVVHLSRPLDGEWVLLDARTRYEPGGTGLSTSVLSDEVGTVGTGAQTLLISPR